MALDPSILLQARAPDIGAAIQSGLLTAQQINQLRDRPELLRRRDIETQMLEQQAEAFPQLQELQRQRTESGIAAQEEGVLASQQRRGMAEQDQRRQSLTNFAQRVKPFLDAGDLEGAKRLADSRIDTLTDQGVDSSDTQEFSEILGAGDIDTASRLVQGLVSPAGRGIQSSIQIPGLGAQVTTKTGETRLQQLPQEEQERVANFVGQQAQQKADLARQTTQARQTVKDTKSFKKGLRNNAANANRSIGKLEKLRQAVSLVGTGKDKQIKRLLGPFIPGVDPSNEQALNTQLNQFLMAELANFKGASSDGEREFAGQTVASMGNTTAANLMIINHQIDAIGQASKEWNEFKSHEKAGGTIDDFEFTPEFVRSEPEVIPSKDTFEINGITIRRIQ